MTFGQQGGVGEVPAVYVLGPSPWATDFANSLAVVPDTNMCEEDPILVSPNPTTTIPTPPKTALQVDLTSLNDVDVRPDRRE